MSIGERYQAIKFVIAIWTAANNMEIEIDFSGREGG